MKLWIDDIRPAPEGYYWYVSVNKAKRIIEMLEQLKNQILPPDYHGEPDYDIEVIDIDHDAGEYVKDGGDYIKLLDWLEDKGYDFPIHIHSQNPVGVENMRRIIKRNGWREV